MLERSSDELRRLRARQRPAVPPALPDGGRTGVYLGQVYNGGAIPTAVPRVFLTRPVRVGGSESENSPTSSTIDGSASVPVVVLGPGVPVAGDHLVAWLAGNRWVADVDGVAATPPTTVALPGCHCTTTPAVLDMISADETCDGGMFQSDILRYVPTPPEYSGLFLGANSFLSDNAHTDQYGDTFRYYFTCNLAEYALSRVYANSIFGSPFRDAVRYTWSLGVPGNSCDPFFLTNGQVYLGGDPNCLVTVQLP